MYNFFGNIILPIILVLLGISLSVLLPYCIYDAIRVCYKPVFSLKKTNGGAQPISNIGMVKYTILSAYNGVKND